MARKKKRSVLAVIIAGFFKGLWFILKSIFKGFALLFSFIKRKRQESRINQKEESRPKVNAKYEDLGIIKVLDGDYNKFQNKIFNNQSVIGIILGARGTGKSAIGMRLLENIKVKTNRNICAMGFKRETLPNWINVVNNIEEIPNGSVVLLDEAGIEFSSRESMSDTNKLLSSLLLIARHKDLSIFFISQNCLPSSEKILTPNGIKTIKELRKSDVVYAFDFDNDRLVATSSEKSFNVKKKVVKIYLEDGRILKCSPEHKWIIYNENGLTQKSAKDLNTSKDYLVDVSSYKK